MQQEVFSYAFQLADNFQKSVIQAHPKQSFFYIGANFNRKTQTTKANKALLYKLHFDEQQPKKSDIKSQEIQGQLINLYSFFKDSEDLLYTVKGANNQYSLHKANFPLLEDEKFQTHQVYNSKSEKFDLVWDKQLTQKKYLVQRQQIFNFTDTFQKGQRLIQLSRQSGEQKITYCTVDPIHEFLTYVVDEKQIKITDKSLQKTKYHLSIGPSDLSHILSVDYNPNKQYYMMSCHHECLKFWDIRKPNLPVHVYMQNHHSLILSSQYNPSHDELITCSYDDGTVGLFRVGSVSSSPVQGENCDALVKLYDEHEDSVYAMRWAGFSPWVFASLSYSAANVVVNYVPSVEKYRILL